MTDRKLSLSAAIFININIMLGTGFFINTALLTKEAGSLGSSVYLIVAVLLLPLIMSMAHLLEHNPTSGTLYDFGRYISPFFGFISSWSYFTAKLCSAGLGIHVCLSFLQKTLPVLQTVPLLALDISAIILFTGLNLLNLHVGKQIQISFIIMKIIPIVFVICSGLYLFNGVHFSSDTLLWTGIPVTVPLVLYVFSGFEASCSLSTQIENPKKNGPRAIYISYAICVAIVFLYQFFFYGSLGMYLGRLAGGYLDIFPALLNKLGGNAALWKNTLQTIFHLGIASSSLGSAYGIMFSNSWNLFTLAKNNHVFANRLFTSLNRHSVPFACIIAEGILAITYLLITQGQQVPLQQVGSLGATIGYTFSIIAYFMLCYRENFSLRLPLLALTSCALLLSSYIWTVSVQGPSSVLLVFISLLIFGSFMFYYKHEPQTPLEVFEEI